MRAESRILRRLPALLLSALLLSSGCAKQPQEEGLSGKYKGYNVILLLIDALRPDHLACYGYPEVTAPGIEEIAREGVVFTKAFSHCSSTIESTTSILTSLYPYSHGVFSVFKNRRPPRTYTLAQLFTIYGYSTAWFGDLADPHSGAAKGLLDGFEEKIELGLGESALEWVSRHARGKRPFFMMVHAYDLHDRNFYNRAFRNKFYERIPEVLRRHFVNFDFHGWRVLREQLKTDQEKVYRKLGEAWVKKHAEVFTRYVPKAKWMDRLQDEPEAKYKLDVLYGDGMQTALEALGPQGIEAFVDLSNAALADFDGRFIRGLIGMLKSNGAYGKTVIVVIADHGNEYMEHGSIGHGASLYGECVRVPLIFRLPRSGRRVRADALAQSVDIMPTILDLTGIRVPAQAQGISLAGVMENASGAPVNRYVYGQAFDGSQYIRSDQWKMILWKGSIGDTGVELYDVAADPGETRNLAAACPDIREELKRELAAKWASLPAPEDEGDDFLPFVDDAMKGRIRKSGYW